MPALLHPGCRRSATRLAPGGRLAYARRIMAAAADFIRAQTRLIAPPLCPELQLHLVTEASPLWQAREADLARLGLPPPFWAFAWPGGQALARHVLDHPHLVRGRRVLDFGAGSGLAAIAAMQAGAALALATDLDPFAVAAISLNAAANHVTVMASTDDVTNTDQGWDLILVGDVFYDASLARATFPWLCRLAARGACVWLGDPHRGHLPPQALELLASYQAPADVDVAGHTLRDTAIWTLLNPP